MATRNLINQGDNNKTSDTTTSCYVERKWGNLFNFYSMVCDDFLNIYWCIVNALGLLTWQKTMHKNKIERFCNRKCANFFGLFKKMIYEVGGSEICM